MSVVHKKLHRTDGGAGGSDSWYLRISDGNIYGPVSISVLAEWAAQLRIAPGNEVSVDREQWQLAESLPELKMVWMAEMPSGNQYGPFNVLAVPYLCSNGTLPPDSQLTNQETGKKLMVHELLSGFAEESAAPELKKKKEGKWESLYKEEKSARVKAEAAFLQEKESLDAQLKEARSEIEKNRHDSTKRITELTKADKEKIEDATHKGVELQNELELLRKQAESDAGRIEEAKAMLKKARSEVKAMESLRNDFEKVQAERDNAKAEAEKEREEVAALNAKLIEVQAGAKDLSEKLNQVLSSAPGQELVDDLKTSLELSRTELTALKKTMEEENKAESSESSSETLLRNDIEAARRERDTAQEDLHELNAKIKSLTDDAEREKTELLQKIQLLEKRVENAHAEISRLNKEKTDADEQLISTQERLETRVKELESLLSEADEEKCSAQKILAEDAEKNLVLNKQYAQVIKDGEETIGRLNQEIKALVEKIENADKVMESEVAGVHVETESLKKQLADMADAHRLEINKLRDELGAQSEVKSKLEESLSEKELERKRAEETENRVADDLRRQLKHVQDVADTSAGVIEKLNGQILKYRGEYQDYQVRVEKLMAEVDLKKNEINDLSRKYEPMLKNAQRHEKELMKKVSMLESENSRLSRPVESISDKAREIGAGLRKGLLGAESFLERFPFIVRTSVVGVIVLIVAVLMFHIGSFRKVVSGQDEATVTSDIESDVTNVEPLMIADVEVVAPVETTVVVQEAEPVSVGEEKKTEALANEVAVVEAAPAIQLKKTFDTSLFENGLDLDLPPARLTTEKTVPLEPAVKKTEWPVLNVPGVSVNYSENMCKMVFDEGVFPYMTTVSEAGMRALSGVAAQLRGSSSKFTLIVEGHTDSVPVSSQASVQGNYELGMSRAKVVAELFVKKFGLPATFIIPTSMGEKDSPFSNDDDVSRKKNRTVVLNLISH